MFTITKEDFTIITVGILMCTIEATFTDHFTATLQDRQLGSVSSELHLIEGTITLIVIPTIIHTIIIAGTHMQKLGTPIAIITRDKNAQVFIVMIKGLLYVTTLLEIIERLHVQMEIEILRIVLWQITIEMQTRWHKNARTVQLEAVQGALR